MKIDKSGRVVDNKIVKMEIDDHFVDAKTCSKCFEVKPLTDFNKRKNGLGGRHSKCRECYNKATKKKKAEYDKEYREENHDRIIKRRNEWAKDKRRKDPEFKERERKIRRKYNSANKKRNAKRWAKYYDKNKDRLIEKQKTDYHSNKEKYQKRWREYYHSEKGQEAVKRSAHKRRDREKQTIATLTSDQWRTCLEKFDYKCAYCGKDGKITIDHFVPVSKGGELTKHNAIPACEPCNYSKRDRDFSDWYPKQPFYSKTQERKILRYLGYKDRQQQISLF